MIDFSNMVWQPGLYGMIPFGLPPVRAALGALMDAGEKMLKMAEDGGKLVGMLAGMGWPSACDQAFFAPFDVFNDTLRGFMNTTMDVIEYPDELLEALKTQTRIQVRDIKRQFARSPWMKNVVFFLHNGFDSFMSREDFETFYWPGLLECTKAAIECGGVPNLYVEDCYDSKLDIIARDLPAGKCILTLINCNVEKAKELFTGKVCLSGGVDGVLLEHGTKEQVIQNVKNAIDLWAPGGGYYLNCDVSLDHAKPENLHALFDTARSYMKY
jgi:uroporphyrinogen-III decarboxylase